MNELIITGKVLNAYINDNGHFTCTIATVHDHFVDGFNYVDETIFRCFLPNREKSKAIDIIKGDKVKMTGYIKQDHYLNKNGKPRKKLNIYAKSIELINE